MPYRTPRRAPSHARLRRRADRHPWWLAARGLDLLHKLLTGGAALATLLRLLL